MEMAWSAKKELSLVDASDDEDDDDDEDVTVVDRWCRDEVDDDDGTATKPLVVATVPKAAAMARELAERSFMMNKMNCRCWFDVDERMQWQCIWLVN